MMVEHEYAIQFAFGWTATLNALYLILEQAYYQYVHSTHS